MSDNHGTKTLESMSQAVWYNSWLLGKFKKHLGKKILEVGCGIGNFSETISEFGKVWSIDIETEYVKKKKKTSHIGFGNIEAGKYFFKKQKFDSIVCLNVLEHIKDDQQALKNIYDLLNNNGYLILLVPAHQFLYGEIDKSISHYRRYSSNKLQMKIKEVGFSVISHRQLNILGALGWFFAGRVLREKVVGENKISIFNKVAPFLLPIEDIIEPPFGISLLIIAQKTSY